MSLALTPQSIIKASAAQVSCRVGEETVVLQVDSGQYLGMDPVTTTIWEFIQQPRTFGEVQRFVLEEFEVPNNECTADLIELFEDLLKNNLIEIAGERAS